MAKTETQQTDEAKAEDAAEVSELKSRLFSKLDKGGGAPAEGDAEAGAEDAETEEAAETETEEAERGRETEEPKAEDDGAAKTDEDADAEKDEELVPRSKVDKMIARQEQRINALTAQLNQLKTDRGRAAEAADPERAKLEAMDAAQLRALKREVRIAQAGEKDAAKLDHLVDLELKIDEVAAEAPARFQARQVALYNAAAEELMQDEELGDLQESAPKLRKLAQEIYARYPKLQRAEEGQAIALNLAAEQFKVLRRAGNGDGGKREVKDLKQKVNGLKRKVALDTTRGRGASEEQSLHQLRESAFRGAENRDRIALIKKDPIFNIDSLIPKEYKE